VDDVVLLPPGSGPSDRDFGGARDFADVGSFRQGDPLSRWALGRYLLGRALAVQVSRVLFVLALLVGAVAVAAYFGGLTVLAVLIALVAVVVLGARAILGALLRRLTVPALAPGAEQRMRALVADTRKDVTRELRRIGLPSRSVTLPLLAVRLAGRRRAEVLTRLREFDVERVVPANRLDDLHLLLQAQASRGEPLR
jgi:hypothetical protein